MQACNIIKLESFWTDLFNWYAKYKRTLPWRNTNDPYHILVAEVLLQKTKAGVAVIDSYNEIIKRYPTVNDLYKAVNNDLLELIKPLGLTRRAEYLTSLAKVIVEHHNSIIPCTLYELQDLPGIGQYSARAILSFAFCCDTPIVDINIARFLYRFLNIDCPFPRTPTRDKQLLSIAKQYVTPGHSKHFNYALLDLCAIICIAKKPLCNSCPISDYCKYYSSQLTTLL